MIGCHAEALAKNCKNPAWELIKNYQLTNLANLVGAERAKSGQEKVCASVGDS